MKKMKQVKVQEHSIEEETRGKYMPFCKIWEKEGMDQSGLEALPGKLKLPRTLEGKKHVV